MFHWFSAIFRSAFFFLQNKKAHLSALFSGYAQVSPAVRLYGHGFPAGTENIIPKPPL